MTNLLTGIYRGVECYTVLSAIW